MSRRYFVTGTDTDVGKTRVSAALALALRSLHAVTLVKIVQTGLESGETGDAARAGALAGVPWRELRRFRKAADPWSAALDERREAPRAQELAAELGAIGGALVAEGAGGLMVPLNAHEDLARVAELAELRVVLAIGLRLGCMNHALLTLARCAQRGLAVAGCVLVDRWEESEPAYVEDVRRALQGKAEILCMMTHDADEARAVERAAQSFLPFLEHA